MIDNKKISEEDIENVIKAFGNNNVEHFGYGKKVFKNKKDLLCFAYYLAKDKRSNLTELCFVNLNPQKFDENRIFPIDMFSCFYRNDLTEPLNDSGIMLTPLPNTFDEFYNNYIKLGNPPISIAFSLDSKDKKRVNLEWVGTVDENINIGVNNLLKEENINFSLDKFELLGSAFNFEKGDMEYMMSMFAEIVTDFVMDK